MWIKFKAHIRKPLNLKAIAWSWTKGLATQSLRLAHTFFSAGQQLALILAAKKKKRMQPPHSSSDCRSKQRKGEQKSFPCSDKLDILLIVRYTQPTESWAIKFSILPRARSANTESGDYIPVSENAHQHPKAEPQHSVAYCGRFETCVSKWFSKRHNLN